MKLLKNNMKFTKDNFLIIFLTGILLLVIVWPLEDKKTDSQSKQWDSEDGIIGLNSDSISDAADMMGSDIGTDAMRSYAMELERSLEEILGTMEGVGKVKVMVTLEGSGEALVEKDQSTSRNGTTEVDSAGGSRNTTDISGSEETVFKDSGSTPYVKKVLSPRVEGVVVSAQGGQNAKTVQNITEAIQALFGIEAHKIKIVKMISQ
ncbi:MAG: stage III sporulation protein AG [Lachnospiraceae bacterium]|nr:stage III sporulation protein AG [Lachnospiraceae bacterium]